MQAYLAVDETVDGVIGDAELGWADDRKLRFIAQNIVDALAPANAPLINPEVIKGAIDSGGLNFVRGARQFARDMREPPRLPANVDVSKFVVGRNIGLSPGAVVLRDERFELIHYQPATTEVREVPILLVPPMINKFYIMDLAPGRSHIEHLVQSGQEVFPISWRNPRAEHRDWGLDAYAAAVLEAFEAVLDISGCIARTSSATAPAAWWPPRPSRTWPPSAGSSRSRASPSGSASSTTSTATSWAHSRPSRSRTSRWRPRRGRGTSTGETSRASSSGCARTTSSGRTWSATGCSGRSPRRSTSSTGTRTPPACPRPAPGLPRDRIGELDVPPRRRHGAGLAGRPRRITVDSYVVAGAADHISPWQNCYRTTQLLGGRTRFVLSTSGHIAAIVNPPGNKRATYRAAGEQTPPDSAQWEELATTSQGTWWTDWDEWLAERSGGMRPAPARLGNRRHTLVGAAPGEYVLEP